MPSEPTPPRTTSSSPRVELITDAVITAYIHAISPRHRHLDPLVHGLAAPAQAA